MGIWERFNCYKSFIVGLAVLLIFGLVYSAVAVEDLADSEIVDRAMGHGDAAEIVVARVNGVAINMASLMGRMLDISQKRFGRREIAPIMAEKIKNESLEQLITGELAFQVANKKVSVKDDELKAGVEARIKALGGEETLERYMQAYHLKNMAEFSEQVKRYLVVDKYINENIVSQVNITDEMIEASYLGSAGQYFNKPEIVQVTKIVFFLEPSSAESFEKIKEVKAKIVNELDGDPTAMTVDGTFIVQENIKLSDVSNKKLYDVAKKLEKFEISDVVQSNGTLHLLQLTGYQEAVHKPLEEVRGYLKNELFGRVKLELVKDWMGGLREGANVDILDITQ